jgi:hypothetical protein
MRPRMLWNSRRCSATGDDKALRSSKVTLATIIEVQKKNALPLFTRPLRCLDVTKEIRYKTLQKVGDQA